MLRWKSSLKPASGGSSTVTLTDDFNRTDTLLESVATDEGWYWVNAKSAPDTMSVSSNKARVTNSNDSTAYYADYSLGTDAEVQTTVTNEYLDRSSAVSVTARYTDNDNRYYVNRSHNSDDFRLYSRVGGSNTEIGTRYTADPSVPYTMKLVCNGDQISVYIDGVLRIGPVTDTSITTGNYVGIGGYNNGNNRIEVDDFVASSLSASASGITLEASAENEAFTGYNSPYNISVSYPAVSADDILLAIISTERRVDFDGTPPTGWTKVIEQGGDNAFNPTQAVYWKRATGSAAATSETWSSIISGSQSYYAWVGAYSGCVTSVSPIDASAGVYQGYATSWSISITTQTDDAMILAVAGSDSNVRTFVWSDGTELIDKVYQSTGTVTINEKIESTAGATTRAGTMSAGQSGTITAVSLRPVGGEPTPLQTRTVTFTSISEFTIDSDSGQEIWKSKLNQANVGSGLRLWNGSEAGNSGATENSQGNWPFSSNADCATWWGNYYIRVKQDPGTGTYSDWINWTDADGLIYPSCQSTYNNIGSAVVHYSGPGTWTTHASGFKYQVEIYSASNRP